MKNRKRMIGILLLLAGIVCIVIKGFTPETIDSEGILHEAFWLLPCGFGCMFAGLIVIVLSFFRRHV